MSHGDQVHELPAGFHRAGGDADLPVRRGPARHAAVLWRAVSSGSHAHAARRADLPEFPLRHLQMLRHWTMGNFIEQPSVGVRKQVGEAKVICGLSGGVDSPSSRRCCTRPSANNWSAFSSTTACCGKTSGNWSNPRSAIISTSTCASSDATKQFLAALAGVTDPQQKRKIIGREFIEAFKRERQIIDGPNSSPRGRSIRM
jgi:GMP synthase (glutamine-hydrolysing)